MTEEFTYSSTDPDRYNEIFCPVPYTTASRMIEWSVTQITGYCNIKILTKDDYIEFDIGSVHRIYMDDDYSSVDTGFYEILQALIDPVLNIKVKLDNCGRYYFTSTDLLFCISDASYRMKQVLGLYHEKLPLKSTFSFEADVMSELHLRSVGYSYNSSMLMLISNIGTPNVISDRNNPLFYRNYYVAMKFSNNLTPGQPLCATGTESPCRSMSNSLSNLQLKLVDSNFEPVLLMNPLFATVSVSGIEDKMQEYEEAMQQQPSSREFQQMRKEFYETRKALQEQKVKNVLSEIDDPRTAEYRNVPIKVDDDKYKPNIDFDQISNVPVHKEAPRQQIPTVMPVMAPEPANEPDPEEDPDAPDEENPEPEPTEQEAEAEPQETGENAE